MALLTWNESLSVNVRDIDEQHQKLVGMLNLLHEAMGKGQGKDVLKTLLGDLARYTVTHFANEEAYMKRFDYAELAAHKAEHEALKSKVVELKARFEGGQTMLTVETMNFLKNWLTDHIQGSDKKYTPCFIAHGLK